MNENLIIYGAGKWGKIAIEYLKDIYNILFVVDSDKEKWGDIVKEKILVQSPEILKKYRNTKVIIASSYYEEILQQLRQYELKDVSAFKVGIEPMLPEKIVEGLDKRTINLGYFWNDKASMECKELTFIPGGSGILDYFFLKQVAEEFHCKSYLEIGTYIGESINILTDVCEHLYSITAPLNAAYSAREWCKKYKLPDYSERLAYNEKIIHFYGDSKKFDYSQIPGDIDLFFVDGDHSYNGVYSDTKNVFSIRKEEAIVIWHDFKMMRNQYNTEVVKAVADALGDKFQNVYVTDNNICGIYLPDCYKSRFRTIVNEYTGTRDLYVYDTKLHVHVR